MIKTLKYIMFLWILLSANSVSAQLSAIYSQPNADYLSAMDLYTKQKFGAAQYLFKKTIEAINEPTSEMSLNCEYYLAVCAIELYNPDAERLMLHFITEYPENAKVHFAYFQMGKYKYFKKEYADAKGWFEKVDLYDLEADEKDEYHFKLGYSYFVENDTANAKKEFFEVKDKVTRYSNPANYYYAHLAYMEKNYETALKGFTKLKDDENFGPIVPYYITQIYYLQGKYQELLDYAPPLLEKPDTKRAGEISRLIGDAYYNLYKYKEALPYLEKYQKETAVPLTKEDWYELGYTYYKTGDCDKAIVSFEKIIYYDDSLSQNAYYHLADCYMKKDNKHFARTAFQSAYKLGFNKKIQEEALLNYAKLSYELSFNPYNEAVEAFQKYIKEYPNSYRTEEANMYLVAIFMTTQNYKDAYLSIENIKNKDFKIKTAYQKITYFRGVELFNDKNYTESVSFFDKSLLYPIADHITAQSLFWKAESFYRLENYDSSITNYNHFLLKTTGAYSLPIYPQGFYNLGYAHFKKKDYINANVAFRKYILYEKKESKEMITDASLRIADCFFINKEYNSALDYYDKVIKSGIKTDIDYAIYQRGCSWGAAGNFEKKAEGLKDLIDNYKKSAYFDDALYELATTYEVLDQPDKALFYYNSLINEHKNSSYTKKALLKIGLIQFNSDKDAEALVTFKKVVNDFPASTEAKAALVSIRNIYTQMNKVDDFFAYVKNLSFANVTNEQQDSITYTAAENKYLSGDCASSSIGFKNYIEKFPNGYFVINSSFYRAECDYKAGKPDDALKGYQFVIDNTKSRFTENALIKAASISFTQKNFANAIKYYTQLEETAEYKNNILLARIGLMRSYFNNSEFDNAIKASEKLLATEKITPDNSNEAHYIIAKSALAMNNITLAQKEFEMVAKLTKSEIGIESRYNLALIQFQNGNYKETEKMIFALLNEGSSYDYWMAKSYILLADNYVKTGNIFQAKLTLQSIIDNSEKTELVDIAKQKLQAIIDSQPKTDTKTDQQDIIIDYENPNK
jgi:TolA-binding protein